MRTIWKYPCSPDVFEHRMPKGAEIVAFDTQGEEPAFWAIVDDTREQEWRGFAIVGTGHSAPAEKEGHYIGTCQQMGGALVWHLFELVRPS